ncbi:SGNH/GDSL hydrolase family protein [Legionella brunensis]|uniref:Lysophospholipase A n=1 Tax=Legionella brunensis TaxID=29422 RepID=A0A0W0SPK5_9GAMM|nr:SGNH/GDSL hydrolase family protein [Legionella brunensis]KTC84949.1 lysophospholipase A [Legionella brunensis]
MFRKSLTLLFLYLITSSAFSTPASISNVVVFGDSFSDRGFIAGQGGFNRYSNGPVWPEYLTNTLSKTCLQDYAWGGAKSDQTNFNHLNWSGLLWQIDRYQMTSNPEKTLHIIWVGVNDLLLGDTDGKIPAANVMVAIDKLINKGVKHIAIFNLPDFSLAPAYNDSQLPEYKEYSPLKNQVKQDLKSYNETLKILLEQKKKDYSSSALEVNIYFVDLSNFFTNLIKEYNNKQSPWQGTYTYPKPNNYFWWDHWHPTTSVHQRIAQYVKKSLEKQQVTLENSAP